MKYSYMSGKALMNGAQQQWLTRDLDWVTGLRINLSLNLQPSGVGCSGSGFNSGGFEVKHTALWN